MSASGTNNNTRHFQVPPLRESLLCTECKVKKGKVVPALTLTEHHAMKAYWGSGGTAPPIL